MKKVITIIIIALMIIPAAAAANNIWWWFSSTEYAMFNGTSKEITGLNISCNNIIGSPDTDFCTDATGGGGTGKSGDGLYLYNDTTIMYFNETLLNSTIDARDTDTTYTNTSPISLSGTTFGLSVCSDTQILKMSGSDWVCSADATGAGGDKSGDGLYLYNDTTVIYFNL